MDKNREHVYRLGHSFKDTGGSSKKSDQFLRWINIPGSGMLNSPGIRPLKFIHLDSHLNPANLILVTHTHKRWNDNPWEDHIDLSTGTILYWGDAKYDPAKQHNDFLGNRILEKIWHLVLEDKRSIIPPILHFSKPQKGVVVFNGLCVLTKLELTWFEDHGFPVRNFRAHLTILDLDEIAIFWLHDRSSCRSLNSLHNKAPRVWKNYLKGKTSKLDLWKSKIRGIDEQLPPIATPEADILDQLTALSPIEFEAVTVALFRQLENVKHSITRTQPTADGGFDFFGHFTLPFPLSYDISFLGEAKKFSRKTAVQPKHISRLVARLNRGQYGIFVTTSYYTQQAQREVIEDAYPVKLFSGIDLVNFMKELRLIRNERINKEWLQSVKQGLKYPEQG